MKCPICDVDLQMTERQGIEIDYCSQCRGVWLDRGELDKIVEKSAIASPGSERRTQETPQMNNNHKGYYDHQDDYGSHGYGHKKYKKEGFLGELFDF